jgi:hypothetical protein
MKTFLLIFFLVYLALPSAVLAKPTATSHKKEILNKLFVFKQDNGEDGRIILVQDDGNGGNLEQAGNDAPGIILEQGEGGDRTHQQEKEEAGTRVQGDEVIQNLGKLLETADKNVILAKLENLKVHSAQQSEAEAQFLHHILHWLHHLFHHHHHHHHHHQQG